MQAPLTQGVGAATSMPYGVGGAWSPPSPMTPIKPAPLAGPRRRGALGGIALGVGALAVLGLGGFFLFSGDSKKKKKKSSDKDDDDDDKVSKKDPVDQKAADCAKLAAFQAKAEKDAEPHKKEDGSAPSADDLDAFAETLDALSTEASSLDLKTPEAKAIAARYAKSLSSLASSARGVASALRTNDTVKLQSEAEKVQKTEEEINAIDADAKRLCPNLDADDDGS